MKNNYQNLLLGALLLVIVAVSCKKSDNDSTDLSTLKTEILTEVSTNVCSDSYKEMLNNANALKNAVNTLNASTTDANLESTRTAWKNMRITWEQTEAWLFGPVEADEIDPRIDTWPVDFTQLDQILNNGTPLTEVYVDGLDDALKGFHPIEYLLWGTSGTKRAAAITAREKEYLLSLTENLTKLTTSVSTTWNNGYNVQLATAGNGSTEFSTQLAAYTQLVDAMSGICDEVANAKIKEPFETLDASKEESPFAKNSIADFTNNIKGVMVMYSGNFNNKEGKGIEDLVRASNLSLDAEIKSKYAAAISALGSFNKPFGEAITAEPTTIQNAMSKVNELQVVLDTKLKTFIQQQVK